MNLPPPRLLIVEDDATIGGNLYAFFEARGFSPDVAYDGNSAMHRLSSDAFDVVILDVGLPGTDGLNVLHRLRNELALSVPVLLLTARDDISDKLSGFARGADDYVTKPFSLVEVEARIRALIARAAGRVATPVRVFGPLQLDARRHELRVHGALVRITPKGWGILEALMRDPGSVVSRGEIEHALWGDESPENDALRSQIHLLRRALADAGFDGIETVHGIGFRLAAAPGHGQ